MKQSLFSILCLLSVAAVLVFCASQPASAGNMRMIEKRIAELKAERARAMEKAGEMPATGTVEVEAKATPSATDDSGYSYKIIQKSVIPSGPMPPVAPVVRSPRRPKAAFKAKKNHLAPKPPKDVHSAKRSRSSMPFQKAPKRTRRSRRPNVALPLSSAPTQPALAPKPVLPHKNIQAKSADAWAYTVQLISAKNRKRCLYVITGLRDLGEKAFSSPVTIPGKGDWIRIHIGAYETLVTARAEAKRLKDMKFSDAFVAKAPFALLAAMASRKEDLVSREQELRQQGIQGYVLPINGGQPGFRLLVGAYRNKKEAAGARSSLGPDMATMTIVTR